jgi:crotonobetainyl-CoA:carnitine CoA-transferase CaiB-like acyl-CoA transferase
MLIEVSHPAIGALKMAGSPLKLAGLTNPPRRPPPLLGEHTDQVLAEVLQLTPVEIGELRKRGVV